MKKFAALITLVFLSACAASNSELYAFDPMEFISTQNKRDRVVINATNMEFQDIGTYFTVTAFLLKKEAKQPSSVTMHFRSVSYSPMLRLPPTDKKGKPQTQLPQQLELLVDHKWYKFPFNDYRASLRGTAAAYSSRVVEDVDIFMSAPAFIRFANSEIAGGRIGLLGLEFNEKKQAILKEVADLMERLNKEAEFELGGDNNIENYEFIPDRSNEQFDLERV